MSGFTLVELLIVIVIVGALAAITFVAYNGIQTRSQNAKITADLTNLEKAMMAARENKAQPLMGFLSGCGGGGESACCFNNNYTSLDSEEAAPECWQAWKDNLATLSRITGISLDNMLDPWGQPYIIELHEHAGNCSPDTLYAAKPPTKSWNTTRVGIVTLPKSSYC